jgi:hypothetical protein
MLLPSALCLLLAGFFLDLFIYPEDGSQIFLRNIGSFPRIPHLHSHHVGKLISETEVTVNLFSESFSISRVHSHPSDFSLLWPKPWQDSTTGCFMAMIFMM